MHTQTHAGILLGIINLRISASEQICKMVWIKCGMFCACACARACFTRADNPHLKKSCHDSFYQWRSLFSLSNFLLSPLNLLLQPIQNYIDNNSWQSTTWYNMFYAIFEKENIALSHTGTFCSLDQEFSSKQAAAGTSLKWFINRLNVLTSASRFYWPKVNMSGSCENNILVSFHHMGPIYRYLHNFIVHSKLYCGPPTGDESQGPLWESQHRTWY